MPEAKQTDNLRSCCRCGKPFQGTGLRRMCVACRDSRAVAELINKKKSRESLSARELQVVGMIAKGMQNKQIAWDMNLSANTVKVYLKSILLKLGCQNRIEVAIRVLNGTLTSDAPIPENRL